MNGNFPIHLTGRIYWLPPHRPEKKPFPPEQNFRALGQFTFDYSLSLTVVCSYSSANKEKGLCEVRLNFPFGDVNLIHKMANHTEIIILDGWKVLAVCRNLEPITNNSKMGDPWIKDN